ncbi:hypothetical protein AAG570_005349 [Ranatra chinensis]|uniref:Uncharacterized protein n=1 Tax=Ranatra chinensis TaxID=642074 RepID=A0ABD0Y1R4_9HEMI
MSAALLIRRRPNRTRLCTRWRPPCRQPLRPYRPVGVRQPHTHTQLSALPTLTTEFLRNNSGIRHGAAMSSGRNGTSSRAAGKGHSEVRGRGHLRPGQAGGGGRHSETHSGSDTGDDPRDTETRREATTRSGGATGETRRGRSRIERGHLDWGGRASPPTNRPTPRLPTPAPYPSLYHSTLPSTQIISTLTIPPWLISFGVPFDKVKGNVNGWLKYPERVNKRPPRRNGAKLGCVMRPGGQPSESGSNGTRTTTRANGTPSSTSIPKPTSSTYIEWNSSGTQ